MPAVVRDLREMRSVAGPEEIEEFETDVFAGFVLARSATGLSDSTIRSDVSHLEQVRTHQRKRAHRAVPWRRRHPRSPPHRPPARRSLTRGPDPLHLAVVFGVTDTTAIRYSNAARHLRHTTAEIWCC